MGDPINIRNKKGSLGVTITDTTNANLQGVSGPAAVGDSNTLNVTNNITAADFGAIDAAERVSLAALDSTQAGLDNAIRFADSIGTRSLDLADSTNAQAFGAVDSIAGKSLDAASDALTRAAQFAQDASNSALDFAFNATRSESQAIGQDAVSTVKYLGLALALAWAVRGLK